MNNLSKGLLQDGKSGTHAKEFKIVKLSKAGGWGGVILGGTVNVLVSNDWRYCSLVCLACWVASPVCPPARSFLCRSRDTVTAQLPHDYGTACT